MLAAPPFGASSNIALWRAYNKPPVELVVADLVFFRLYVGKITLIRFVDIINISLSIYIKYIAGMFSSVKAKQTYSEPYDEKCEKQLFF